MGNDIQKLTEVDASTEKVIESLQKSMDAADADLIKKQDKTEGDIKDINAGLDEK